MKLQFYKYQGAGNDFIMIDAQNKNINLNTKQINFLCNRNFGIGADGLIFLQNHNEADFYMKYYNSDGNESTMCGNGGRCIVKFAFDLNLIKSSTSFLAIDGIHKANILENWVKLEMIDVNKIEKNNDDFVLNTGSPHYVKFIENIKNFDVFNIGKNIRYSEMFKKIGGLNVNFVEQIENNHIFVRTYERGVENETLACGTGITAATLAYAEQNNIQKSSVKITSLGGDLKVSFEKQNSIYKNIWLEGEAKFVFDGNIEIL